LEYVPFGETFIDERRSQSSWTTPYLFSGKERDEETGLLYFGARYQDSKYGIWYSVDPLAEKYPNVSSYVYCHDNPINMIDPDGMADLKFQKKQDEKYVAQQAKNTISDAADKLGVKTIPISSTYRSAESQINAMYKNCKKTSAQYQINEVYGKKGDAVCRAYQAAYDAGKSETEIKTEMLKVATEVGFTSTHSSPNYSKLNAVDMPMTGESAKSFSNALKETQSNVVTRLENGVVHAEIPVQCQSQLVTGVKLPKLDFKIPVAVKDNTNVVRKF